MRWLKICLLLIHKAGAHFCDKSDNPKTILIYLQMPHLRSSVSFSGKRLQYLFQRFLMIILKLSPNSLIVVQVYVELAELQ